MSSLRNINITFKLTIAFVLFAGILLLGLSIPAYLIGRESIRNATVSELESTSLEKQSALEAWISNRKHTIRDLASHKYMGEMIASLLDSSRNEQTQIASREAVLSILNDWSGIDHNFVNLQVIDVHNGQIILSTDPNDIGKFREDQSFFIDGMKSAYIQNPYYDLSTQKPIMTASAPIISLQGKVIAVLAGSLNMVELNEIILRRTGLHQSDDVFLANSSHFFITQPRLIPDPAVLSRGIYTEAVTDCLNQTNGEIDTIDYREIPSIIVYRWLPTQQLCLITKLDQEEAYAPIRSLAVTMIITGLVVLFLGSLGALLLSRSITKPVFELAHGTTQLRAGNLDYRIQVTSKDELGDLGKAFNQMAEVIAEKDTQLRNWAEELEEKVEQRTAELTESEIRYRTLMEASPDMTFVVNRDIQVQYVNNQAASLLGNSVEEIIGKPISNLFPPDITEHQVPAIQQVIQTGHPLSSESMVSGPGGERWLDSRIVPIMDKEGHVNAVMGVSRDITERKKAEAALKEVNEYLDNLITYANAPIIVWNSKFEITRFNRAFESLTGRKESDLIGQNLKILFPVDSVESSMKYILKAQQGERWETVEIKIISKNNSIHTILWNSAPIYSADGKELIATIAQGQDITGRKMAEEEIRLLNQELESKVVVRTAQLLESNKQLESFSYSVSHDLRAPLRALDGFSLAILEDYSDKLDEDGRKYLNRIREASQKMANLIDAMLILSRVTKADLNRSEVNLSEIVFGFANELKIRNPERDVTWKIESGMVAEADPVLIKSAMENLLSNSWKFSSKHPSATIDVGSIHENGEVVYFVRDDGAGFDMTYASKLFGAFQRMHSTVDFEGTGIGLATVHRIITKHGGRIWAEGKPEAGATFYFTLNNSMEKK
jgi:PAS domain S-box-containing protein